MEGKFPVVLLLFVKPTDLKENLSALPRLFDSSPYHDSSFPFIMMSLTLLLFAVHYPNDQE